MVDLGEFGLGIAPKESRPINKIELSKEKEDELKQNQAYEPDMSSQAEEDFESNEALLNKSKMKGGAIKRQGVDKQTAFLEYKKSDEGVSLETSIKDNRAELKGLKTNVKDMTEKCNEYKKNIDVVKFELDKKQDERRENQKL